MRRVFLAGCLLFILCGWVPGAGNPYVLPQFVFGDGWYTALYFSNLTGSPVSFPVNFTVDGGTPMTLPLLGASSTVVNLPAYGTAIVEAPNLGTLVEGFASFTLPSGVFGYGVFRQTVAGQVEQEAVVPLSDAQATSSVLTFDETNRVTAVAIVNPSSVSNIVVCKVYDQDGNVIGTSYQSFGPNTKIAAALRSLPGLSGIVGKRGVAQFTVSSGAVAVLGLRFDNLALTSIPTASGSASAAARPSVLPQFVYGAGWYTALYFSNLTSATVKLPVSFVTDSGSPLNVPVLGGATTQVTLPPNGTAIVEAPNVGDLVQGFASFTLPPGVFGYGVFRQTVAGQIEQEAVVPFSDAGASGSTMTWDETNRVTAVAIVNPTPTAATVAVSLSDQNGAAVGTSSIPLPPNSKTEAALRNLSGLGGMAGKRGTAKFMASSGTVSVLGLRFDNLALTSIPTAASGNLVAERELAQTGLAVGMASTVLQGQLAIVTARLTTMPGTCTRLTGGGSSQMISPSLLALYYDSVCTKPYVVTGSTTFSSDGNGSLSVVEPATYYSPSGSVLGTITFNESATIGNSTTYINGLGTFVPAGGAHTPVQLGTYCAMSEGSGSCGGGIAQDFPALGVAIGAVTPVKIAYGSSVSAPVTFNGGGTAVTGPIGSLTLTAPTTQSLAIKGGTTFATTTCTGGSASFVLFPPTPTAWTLTDSAHDEQFQISVDSDAARTLTIQIVEVITGQVLATGTLDQSGSGSITYSDGSVAAITNWTLAN